MAEKPSTAQAQALNQVTKAFNLQGRDKFMLAKYLRRKQAQIKQAKRWLKEN